MKEGAFKEGSLYGYGKYTFKNKARIGFFNGGFSNYGKGVFYHDGGVYAEGLFNGFTDVPTDPNYKFYDFYSNTKPN